MDVEVVEVKAIFVGADHDESDALSVDNNVARLTWFKGIEEAGSGAFG